MNCAETFTVLSSFIYPLGYFFPDLILDLSVLLCPLRDLSAPELKTEECLPVAFEKALNIGERVLATDQGQVQQGKTLSIEQGP